MAAGGRILLRLLFLFPASQALFEIRTGFSCRHDEAGPDVKKAVSRNLPFFSFTEEIDGCASGML